jgi:hypothetical protein
LLGYSGFFEGFRLRRAFDAVVYFYDIRDAGGQAKWKINKNKNEKPECLLE